MTTFAIFLIALAIALLGVEIRDIKNEITAFHKDVESIVAIMLGLEFEMTEEKWDGID